MRIEKDMATSRPEFMRNLAIALNGMDHRIDGNDIVAGADDKRIELRLSPLPARVLSPLLKLERWKVTLDFTGHSESERDVFMARFDKAFQRGGG